MRRVYEISELFEMKNVASSNILLLDGHGASWNGPWINGTDRKYAAGMPLIWGGLGGFGCGSGNRTYGNGGFGGGGGGCQIGGGGGGYIGK